MEKNNSDKGKQQVKHRVHVRRMTNKAMDKIVKKAMDAMHSSSTGDEEDDGSENED